MYSHLMVGSNDLARSKRFYDAVFRALGAGEGVETAKGSLIYRHDGSSFVVTRPLDGQPATHANGGTIGFKVTGPEQADAWHRAGVENGGTSIEDPPGLRDHGTNKAYLAYLRDPDGNKLCAVHPMG